MPTTFITFGNNKGFWIHEFYMQLAYYFIYEELIKLQYGLSNKDELLDRLKFHIDGYSSGIMSLDWYDVIKSTEDIQTVISLLENLKKVIHKKGKQITVSELKNITSIDYEFKRLYSRNPFPSDELIKILDALKQMLEGNWESNNYDMKIKYEY